MGVSLDKDLLRSCVASRARYQAYIDVTARQRRLMRVQGRGSLWLMRSLGEGTKKSMECFKWQGEKLVVLS